MKKGKEGKRKGRRGRGEGGREEAEILPETELFLPTEPYLPRFHHLWTGQD